MRTRTFYTAIAPILIASLGIGYISRCSTGKEEEKSTQQQNPEQLPEIDCATIDDVAEKVVQEYAQQFSIPEHVATYVSDNMCNALLVEKAWTIPAAAVLAKAGSEHSYGTKGDKIQGGNNHFGIKCKDQFAEQYPDSFTTETWEERDGKRVNQTNCFVKYASAQESYYHFGQFLATRNVSGKNPYAEVIQHTGSARDFLVALGHSPYSTNSKQTQLTIEGLETYHLDDIVKEVKKQVGNAAEQQTTEDSPESASEHSYQRVLHTSSVFDVNAYSTGFQQGDYILLEFDPKGADYSNVSWTFSVKTNQGKTRELSLPTFEHNGKMYAQAGTDFEYPVQTAELEFHATIGQYVIADTYDVPIAERAFLPEQIGMPSSSGISETPQQKKAKEIFYKSWKPITTQEELYVTRGWHAPTDGECDTSMFGSRRIWQNQTQSRHKGVDCSGEKDDPIYSMLGGTVAYAQDTALQGEGIATLVDHGFGLYSMYLHQSQQTTQKGKTVRAGSAIGLVGSTGRSDGPHLHVQVKLYNDIDIDPFSLQIVNTVFTQSTQ